MAWLGEAEMDRDGIAERISDTAREIYDQRGEPYLLSRIPPDLSAEMGISYKEIIGDQSLLSFVRGLPGLQVVQHPTQKAKIGVVPAGVKFSFDDARRAAGGATRPVAPPRSASSTPHALLSVLRALSTLDEEELDTVHIPVRVMIKLAGIK